MIPSALDVQAIDVAGEGVPAEVPSLSAGVPPGYVLEMSQWIARSNGRELHSQRWYDFEKNRARWDTFGDPASVLGGSSATAVNSAAATILYSAVRADGREVSYDAFSGELRSSPTTTGAQLGEEEGWPTEDTVWLGRQTLDGTAVDVYRVDLNIPRGQERSADFGLIYAESAGSRRVREEWLLGSPGDAWVYHLCEYRLVPRTAELEASLTAQALIDLAAGKVAEKMEAVAKSDFPVWGLTEGSHGLVLSGIRILEADQGTQVSLTYVPEGFIGPPAVTIETNDIRGRSDFPEELLKSREEAVAYSGGTDHIDFRMEESGVGSGTYDTAVRVVLGASSGGLVEPLVLGTVAMELVDVRHLAPS